MPSINVLETPHIYELTAPANPKLPVLVFVHGWLLSRHYWQPLVQLLQSEYQCLIYDARGFGESQISAKSESESLSLVSTQKSTIKGSYSEIDIEVDTATDSPQDYSLNGYANDLGCLLEILEIEQAWLVGHSLGGSIALWTADLYPEVVKGVTCLNAGGGIYLKEEFERFRSAGEQLLKFRPRWLSFVPGLDLLFSRMMVARPLAIRWGRQRVLDFIEADGEAALGALLESTTESEVHLLPQLVSRLQQPVYFIAGEKDKVMEIKYVNHLASFHHLFTSEESNVFQINNCGHLGMLEAPNEVASIINNVLSEYQAQLERSAKQE